MQLDEVKSYLINQLPEFEITTSDISEYIIELVRDGQCIVLDIENIEHVELRDYILNLWERIKEQ